MAQPTPATVAAEPSHMDPSVNQRDWERFISVAKWSSLGILALTFSIICWRVGHTPLVPTFVIGGLAAFGLGKLFH